MVTTTNDQILLRAGLYVMCFMFDISIPFFLSKNPKREVLYLFQMEMWENWYSKSSKSLRKWGEGVPWLTVNSPYAAEIWLLLREHVLAGQLMRTHQSL